MHADHLHLTSLPLVAPDAALVVPRGAAKLIHQDSGAAYSDRCVEVAPGNQVRIGALDITAVTADHDGRRLPWSSYAGPALGYRVEGSPSVWFAGDTDLYDGLAAEVGPVDLALIPVGGWGPSLGPGHLDPVRAAEAVRQVGARMAIPVHFGTFWPIGCDWVRPELFLPPGERFKTAMAEVDPAGAGGSPGRPASRPRWPPRERRRPVSISGTSSCWPVLSCSARSCRFSRRVRLCRRAPYSRRTAIRSGCSAY